MILDLSPTINLNKPVGISQQPTNFTQPLEHDNVTQPVKNKNTTSAFQKAINPHACA